MKQRGRKGKDLHSSKELDIYLLQQTTQRSIVQISHLIIPITVCIELPRDAMLKR